MTQQQRIMLIAALSGADARTVAKQLAGKPARGAVLRQRIEDAARQVHDGDAMSATSGERGPSSNMAAQS